MLVAARVIHSACCLPPQIFQGLFGQVGANNFHSAWTYVQGASDSVLHPEQRPHMFGSSIQKCYHLVLIFVHPLRWLDGLCIYCCSVR